MNRVLQFIKGMWHGRAKHRREDLSGIVHFDRYGPNQYVRRLDSRIFSRRQLAALTEQAAEHYGQLTIHWHSPIPLANSEEDVIP